MRIVGIPIVALMLAACAEPAPVEKAMLKTHGFETHNGLNQIMASFALTSEGLRESMVGELTRTDPYYQEFMKYIVRCALPPGDSVDFGDDVVLDGGIGLAPDWKDAPCDEACQEWVTACIGAHLNPSGLNVAITLEATHPVLGLGSGEPIEEGAFYGNAFVGFGVIYACRGSGYDPLMHVYRRCTSPDGQCGIQWVGPCQARDGDTGADSDRVACATPPEDGGYRECWNRPTLPSTGEPPTPHKTYTRIVKVMLRQSGFTPGCDRNPYDPSAALRPDPLAANACVPDGGSDIACLGAHCINDDGCGGEDYVCDPNSPTRRCAKPCHNDADQAVEADECAGPKTTCMGVMSNTEPDGGRCGIRCAPVGQTGYRCQDGEICTGTWYAQPSGTPDVTGCQPICESDDDCDYGVCNPRFLGCGEPVDMTKLRDGEPCTPSEANGFAPCRGDCTTVDGAPSGSGLCSSFIDVADTPECPDDPDTMRPSGPAGDDARVCIYRRCENDADCTAPLTCKLNGFATYCLY